MLRRLIFAAWAVGTAVWPAVALADAVGPCPPGFEASHSGCHFAPGATEIVACACCAAGLAAGAAVVVVLVLRGRKQKGPREA